MKKCFGWIVVLAAIAFVFRVAGASYRGPEVGATAPALKVTKWLQAPAEKMEGWPTGKVVVLEFWATWCAPCVAAIPHLNELAQEFKDKPVQFVAVTDETVQVVRSFLKKTPIKAWIGLNGEDVFKEGNPYGVYGIPHTVIIDAKGRIAAVMEPGALNAKVIELCLKGEPLGGAESVSADDGNCPIPGVVPGQASIGKEPMFQVMIRPATVTPRVAGQVETLRWSKSAIGLTLPKSRFDAAITGVFDVPRARLVLEAEMPKEIYDFYISLPPRNLTAEKQKPGRALELFFAEAVRATFGLVVKREEQTVGVLVLKTNGTSLEKLAKSTNDGKDELYGFGDIVGIKRPLSGLAEGLENAGRMAVLDETGVTNLYSFHLQWEQKGVKQPNIEGMTAAVKELGLELVKEKRKLEVVVVREEDVSLTQKE